MAMAELVGADELDKLSGEVLALAERTVIHRPSDSALYL
jgi:hypothetical protein